jgi:hypothetical protein
VASSERVRAAGLEERVHGGAGARLVRGLARRDGSEFPASGHGQRPCSRIRARMRADARILEPARQPPAPRARRSAHDDPRSLHPRHP